MRMALAASTGNDSEASVAYLKRAIALDERMAEPHYLLGAEYAGKGLYALAISELQAALARKPELAAARFQLGLLFLTLARVEEAAATWGLLDMLPHEHPFYLFKSGLLHLIQEQFDKATILLKEGIAANTENPALNRDMQLVLEEISRKQAGASGAATASAAEAQHFLVSSYRKH